MARRTSDHLKTEVRVHKPPLKVYFTFGFFGAMVFVVIAAMFIFRFEFGVILVSVSGLGIAFGGGYIWIWVKDRYHEHEDRIRVSNERFLILQAERRRKELEAEWLIVPRTSTAINPFTGDRVDTQRNTVIPGQVETLPDGGAPVQRADIMDVLRKSDCVMLQGGRGSGKTNAALWWISSKQGDKIACDPKGTKANPWPGCRVVSDDNQIVWIVKKVSAEARRRKNKELFNETPIYLLVDELHYLEEDNDERSGLYLARYIFSIITLGREYHVHAAFTTSDGGVKSLGIEGKSGLRDGLTWLEMAQHPVTKERECWVRHSRYGRIPATLPPVYNGLGNGKTLVLPPPKLEIKTCPVCHNELTGKQKYCSNACKQKAYNKRRRSGDQ